MRLGVQVDVTPALQDVDTIVDTARQDVPAIVQAAGRRYLARAQADIPTNARPRRRGRRPLATGFQVRDEVVWRFKANGETEKIIGNRRRRPLGALSMLDETLDATERRRSLEQGDTASDGHCLALATHDANQKHPAEATAHLPCCDVVTGV